MRQWGLVLTASYLLGAIPFGYIMGRLKGMDITRHGSGNIGATNAFRVFGPAAGLAVLLLDAAKGFAAAYLGWHIIGTETAAILTGGLAIFAHTYSIFLALRGGRGVACAGGVLLYLLPDVVAMELAIWLAVVALTRYVSLASILVAALLPFLIYLDGRPLPYLLFGAVTGGFVIYKHRPNIERLLAGTEHRFGKKLSGE